MPRGGKRKGAGRKTQWESGCSFSETVVIRVPKVLKNQLLQIAHRLDAGEEVDLVSKSIQERNDYLESKVIELENKLQDFQEQPLQLEMNFLSNDFWHSFKTSILRALSMGSQSKTYKRVEQALNNEIRKAGKSKVN